MSWKGVKVEDIRFDFIKAVQYEESYFQDVCQAFGISGKTGYKWVKRFNEEGHAGLKDRSRRPLTRPRDVGADIEAAVVAERLKHPTWGPKKIHKVLSTARSDVNWPSKTTMGNILKRKGYTAKMKRCGKFPGAATLEESKSVNDLWSADFKGWWKLGNGSIYQPFTLMDSYSRYLFSCRHSKNVSFKCIKPVLIEAFQEFGLPRRFRTDNGPPFASRSVGRLSRLAIWLIQQGITPEWITPGKPQQNGIHERVHRTMKQEVTAGPAENEKEQDNRMYNFQYTYNFSRPHESLSMQTPSSIFNSSPRKWTGDLITPEYESEFEIRAVDQVGYIKWKGSRFLTTEMLYGEKVGVREKENNIYEVYYGPILLGRIDPILGFTKA